MEQNSYTYHVRKALLYINEYHNRPITLTTAAQALGVNKCYLCKLFKEETGQNFTDYLNQIKIDHSKKLLMGYGRSMLEISMEAGFNSQNYFNILFKRYTGMTPVQYRNIHGAALAG
ncbi:AraC family transcriptional regulator [Oscillospiraceae bacterium MB08-C2-2]|nr:AraC family transcriptional regulator [Oscillospiraceae bacterium MB08-C2-2]